MGPVHVAQNILLLVQKFCVKYSIPNTHRRPWDRTPAVRPNKKAPKPVGLGVFAN